MSSVSGWIQLELFTKWFRHFVNYVKPNKDNPILLLLDGHFSHTRDIEVIEIARENGVILVSIPTRLINYNHWMQDLWHLLKITIHTRLKHGFDLSQVE